MDWVWPGWKHRDEDDRSRVPDGFPTSSHCMMEETDLPRLRGMENHGGRKQQEWEGRTV